MPIHVKLLLLWGVVSVMGLSWILTPWADAVAVVLILGIAPPATLFALVYGFTVPWWETRIGQAMLISSTGLALLVDISLVYQWFGDNYAQRDMIRLTVFTFVLLGAWWKFVALIVEKWQARRERRADRLS